MVGCIAFKGLELDTHLLVCLTPIKAIPIGSYVVRARLSVFLHGPEKIKNWFT